MMIFKHLPVDLSGPYLIQLTYNLHTRNQWVLLRKKSIPHHIRPVIICIPYLMHETYRPVHEHNEDWNISFYKL